MRKKIVTGLMLLAIGLLIGVSPALLARLPVSRHGLRRGAAFTGVLRVWVCEGWSGSALAWATKQASVFEKTHTGIRVQVRRVADGEWEQPDTVLPDLLLFEAGTLSDPSAWLMPIALPPAVRDEALMAGTWRGTLYAVPVSLGGYAALINPALLSGELTPENLLQVNPASGGRKPLTQYALQTAGGGAALALLSTETAFAGGYPQGIKGLLGSLLPGNFAQHTPEKVYADFTTGLYGACVVPVREVRRFAALEAAGKGFAYRTEAVSGAFTDLMLLAGRPQKDMDPLRNAAADALLQAFFTPQAQAALYAQGMLPTLSAAPLPSQQEAPLLYALMLGFRDRLLLPNAYEWRAVRETAQARALFALGQGGVNMWDVIGAVQ